MAKKVMSMPDDKQASPKRSNSLTNTLLLALLVVAVGAFAWSFWSYQNVKQEVAVLKDPQLASELNQKQTEELLSKVSKLLVLPNERQPVVATINDVETLASTQDFYALANNGDKLIIFQNARKAVIYDEDDNKIVNVGPIFVNNAEGEPQAVTPEADRLTIELRNGSADAGSSIAVRDRLLANYTFNVTKLGKTAKPDYTGYIIVDNTNGSKATMLEALQKELGATVVKEAPDGEADPRAEVLVIVGKQS